MKCEECRPLIEDYFDGELDEETNGQMALHLSACARCAAALGELGREQELYLSYECDAEPAPAFWDEVMVRATETVRTPDAPVATRFRRLLGGVMGNFNAPRLSPSLTALIVLAAIGITIAVMRYVNSRGTTGEPAALSRTEDRNAPPASSTASGPLKSPGTGEEDKAGGIGSESGAGEPPRLARSSSGGGGRKAAPLLVAAKAKGARIVRPLPADGRSRTPEELVREAEQKYVAAIQLLSRDVNRRRPRLDPETAARFERTLTALDRNIADTRRAARKHPGDPVAAQYMLAAYSRKVDMLRAMIGY